MKRKSRKPKSPTTTVLVGTYRKDQLEKWVLPQGLYNYPIHDGDAAIRAAAPEVSELWLYLGKAAKRRFSATFDREVSVAALAAMGYPRGREKPHAERYLLFRVAPLEDDGIQRKGAKPQRSQGGASRPGEPQGNSRAKSAKSAKIISHGGSEAGRNGGSSPNPPNSPTPGSGSNGSQRPCILVRLEDFEHDEEALKAKLAKLFGDAKAEKPAASEKPFFYLDCLPEDLLSDWAENLRVCEEAEQLTFDYFFRIEDAKRHELLAVAISREAKKKRKPTCVEICAGAGGQAIGLDLAGFEHVALVEYEREYCDVLKANRPDWNVICGDVRAFDGHPYKGVDLLAGGVPCPPFSAASKQLGESDERDLFPEAIRLVSEIRPRAVMLENVRGFLDPKFDEYRKRILSSIAQLGYSVSIKLLNASDYGVPQLRPRIVIVGIRNDEPGNFEYPPPSGEPAPTVGVALHDLMAKNGWKGADEWTEKADKIAPTVVGGSKKHGGPDLGPARARRAWAELGVDGLGVASDAPPPDFSGIPRLTKEMLSRIQGFPPEWDFGRKKTSACRMIGNAFPPPVAQAVGLQIRKALEHETKD